LLKKLFEKYNLKGTISDVFPAEESSRALALNRYAADKRQDKSMTRTRVINRGGTAYYLQHTTSQDKFYKDANISEDSLKPYFETRQATGNRDRPSGDRTDRAAREDRSRMVARREKRYRNGESNSDKETRDQERAAARNTNSSNATSNNNIHRNRNYRGTNSTALKQPQPRTTRLNTPPLLNSNSTAPPYTLNNSLCRAVGYSRGISTTTTTNSSGLMGLTALQ